LAANAEEKNKLTALQMQAAQWQQQKQWQEYQMSLVQYQQQLQQWTMQQGNHNNSSNKNNTDNVCGAVVMAYHSHRESSPDSSDEFRTETSFC